MFDHINLAGINGNVLRGLHSYLLAEEYDTEGIKSDIDIYDDEKNCNLLEAT